MSDLSLPGLDVWLTEPLGDLCDITIGRTPSRNRPEFWNGDQPWLSIADMNQGRAISKTKEKITALGVAESGSRLIPKGTVLLSFKLSIGKVAVSEIDTYTNEAIASLPILNPNKLFKDFLFWTLRSIRLDEEVDVAAKGKTLNKAKLERLSIPLPPLDEQKRIAALLDKADALRSQRQESIQLTENLLQSVFIEMFVRNPAKKKWTPRTIEWMAKEGKNTIRTGPFGSQLLHSEFVESGIAVLGIDNAVKNRFEWAQPRFISAKKYEDLRRYKVFPGDVIITIMGTCGRCAIVPEGIPEAINTKHLCCITLDQKKCLPEFLHACLLNHPDILQQLGVRAKGAVMPGLNMGIIKGLEIPMPPIGLQEEFKRVIEAQAPIISHGNESRDALDGLFFSLKQLAFQGELDLNRLTLKTTDEQPTGIKLNRITPKAAEHKATSFFLQAPDTVEIEIKKFDATVNKGETIPWSVDYFKYRILGTQSKPFSFGDLLQKAEGVFDEAPPYEEIKDLILKLLGQGEDRVFLSQYFDMGSEDNAGRREILFKPA